MNYCENCGREIEGEGFCSEHCEKMFYEWLERDVLRPTFNTHCDECNAAVIAEGNPLLVLCGECNGSGKTISYHA